MAFTVPSFNLICNLYSGPWLTKALRSTPSCNLAAGRRGRVFPDFEVGNTDIFNGPYYLLLPALTDIRCLSQNVPANDLVEVPQASGRWYSVLDVDDVGKGFPNEHRLAVLAKISQRNNATDFPGLFWPIPMP